MRQIHEFYQGVNGYRIYISAFFFGGLINIPLNRALFGGCLHWWFEDNNIKRESVFSR